MYTNLLSYLSVTSNFLSLILMETQGLSWTQDATLTQKDFRFLSAVTSTYSESFPLHHLSTNYRNCKLFYFPPEIWFSFHLVINRSWFYFTLITSMAKDIRATSFHNFCWNLKSSSVDWKFWVGLKLLTVPKKKERKRIVNKQTVKSFCKLLGTCFWDFLGR